MPGSLHFQRLLLKLLETLSVEEAFSHFRAASLLLQKAPCKEAVPYLEKLLSTVELSGSVEGSFKEIIEENSADPCDNLQRTRQLKENYLLKALVACDSENLLANERLERYAKAPAWLYAAYCGTGRA